MSTDSTSALDILLDTHLITNVLHQYCHSCDHLDEESLRACFSSDALHEHGDYKGPTEHWIPAALAWLTGRVGVTHMIANPFIRIAGDQALSDCHFMAFNRLPKTDACFEEVIVKGRYIDRLVRQDGTWKISHRIGIHDLEIVKDVRAPLPSASGVFHSGPMSDDPYYSMLATFLAAH